MSIGLNCALGPKEMHISRRTLSDLADLCLLLSERGTAGPMSPTGFPETPATMPQLRDWAEAGWLNIVGGCCGTTPDHIRAIAREVSGHKPRVPARPEPFLRLSGLEPLTVRWRQIRQHW
jgi:5-methyltetrahydrofolate--homocysteine methyltransferase